MVATELVLRQLNLLLEKYMIAAHEAEKANNGWEPRTLSALLTSAQATIERVAPLDSAYLTNYSYSGDGLRVRRACGREDTGGAASRAWPAAQPDTRMLEGTSPRAEGPHSCAHQSYRSSPSPHESPS